MQEQQLPLAPNGLRKCRILIVGDGVSDRQLLVKLFRQCGFEEVNDAQDGYTALKLAKTWQPDLILLDLMMPGTDGMTVCEQLTRDESFGAPTVIVLTAQNDAPTRHRLFAAGAIDYLTKPLDMGEVLARSIVHLETRTLTRNAQEESSRLGRSLEEAAQMQKSLLPTQKELKNIQQTYGVNLFGHYRPCEFLGGDIWGVLPIDDRHLGLYLADFSGHGLPAAFNTFRLHGMLKAEGLPFTDPAALMREVNTRLARLLHVGDFATMLYVLYDMETHTLRLCSAAAPEPVIRRKDGSVDVLGMTGLPLGTAMEAQYETYIARLEPGDTFFMYSDGLSEHPNLPQGMLEPRQFGEALTNENQTTENSLAQVVMYAHHQTGTDPQQLRDDETAVIFRLQLEIV